MEVLCLFINHSTSSFHACLWYKQGENSGINNKAVVMYNSNSSLRRLMWNNFKKSEKMYVFKYRCNIQFIEFQGISKHFS
jgi:hypothetical protein